MGKLRACNLCGSFMGCGLHWVKGRCSRTGKEIPLADYRRAAESCPDYAAAFAGACESCPEGPFGDGSCRMASWEAAACPRGNGG